MAYNYFFYGMCFLALAFVSVIFFTRSYWGSRIPALPISIPYIYTAVPSNASESGGTFHDDAAAGLHSSMFDLSANIEGGDARGGLDEQGKREVQRIMKARGLGFDEARRAVMLERFKRAGVGEDGRPRDPKFVSFS